MKEERHLTPEEIALAAELISSNRELELEDWLKDHIKDCDQCASEVLITSQISFDRELSVSMNKSGKKPGVVRQMYIIAASVAAAAALLWGVFYILQPNTPIIKPTDVAVIEETEDSVSAAYIDNDSERQMSQGQSEEEFHPTQDNQETEKRTPSNDLPQSGDNLSETETPLLLASYDTHSELEKLYNNYRGTYRSSSIAIRSDSIVKITETNRLRWDNPDQELLNVEIFNNRNQKVQTFSTRDNHQDLPQMDPGLYYWKLINEDFDLVFVGKLIVD